MVTPEKTFWQGRRVLLTGHTGFKGSWCAFWLERLGAEVMGFSLPPDPGQTLWEQLGEPGGRNFGDIRSPAAVAAAFEQARPELVIHMAAQALVQTSYEDPALTFETNVMGLIHVLNAARSVAGLKAIVNVTSDKCYENHEQLWAYRESDAMGGADPYSASKGCAELVTAAYRRSYFSQPESPRLASARAGNVVGGGDESKDRLIPDCIRAFRSGREALIRNPLAIRPWQHVLEPLCGYLLLGQALWEKRQVDEGWNFGPSDQDAWPVSWVVDRLVTRWGERARWTQDSRARPHEAVLLRVDAAKARARLGWRPRLTVGGALDWTIEWSRARDGGSDANKITAAQISRYEKLPDSTEGGRNGY